MGKVLAIISLVSLVAIVTMAVMVFTSFDHREEAQLQRDILATKTVESRNSPSSSNSNDTVDGVDDSAFPEELKGSGDLPEVHRGKRSSPPARNQGPARGRVPLQPVDHPWAFGLRCRLGNSW